MFVKFVVWFVVGILVIGSVDIIIKNSFITAFIAACIIGVLGARE